MAKMTGLGKGLDALFGGSPLDIQMEENSNETEELEDSKNLKNDIILDAIKSIKIENSK